MHVCGNTMCILCCVDLFSWELVYGHRVDFGIQKTACLLTTSWAEGRKLAQTTTFALWIERTSHY